MTAPRKSKSPGLIPNLQSRELVEALSNAILFAANDRFTPVVSSVLFESDGTGMSLVATDRYVLGATTIPYTGPVRKFIVDVRDAKELLHLLKTRGRRVARMPLPYIDVTLVVTDATVSFTFDGISVSYALVEGEFPKWRSLFDGATDGETGTFDPRKMVKFAKVLPAHSASLVRIGARNKPATVTVGDRFRGLIMTIRESEDVA